MTGFDLEARLHGGGEGEIERRWSRSLLDRRGAAIDETDGVWVVGLELGLRSVLL